MSIELKQAAQRALNALDEATTYTGSPSWSPSMTDECIAAASALRTALAQQPATGVPAGYVPVPLQVLRDASEALGNFVSDHGWGDTDMQAMDNLDAYIARHDAKAQKGQP